MNTLGATLSSFVVANPRSSFISPEYLEIISDSS